jgi:ketosteroid isomerase-like protein
MKYVQALMIVLLAGCATPTEEATRDGPLPPELQRVLTDYETAWQARDAEALAQLFADDRVVVANNACPPVRGRAEIQTCSEGAGGDLSLSAISHDVGGAAGYLVGEYAAAQGSPPGGKFVLTLTKDPSGRWLIVSDMDRAYPRPPRAQ